MVPRLALVLVTLGACATATPRPAPPAVSTPRLAALDTEGVRLYALDTHGAHATGTVPLDGIQRAAWRTPDELVVMTLEGAVLRVAPDGTSQPVPEPAPGAWPDTVFAEVEGYTPREVDREDARGMLDLAVVDGAIWQAHCAEAYWNDAVRCATWSWIRIAPFSAHVVHELAIPSPRWQRATPSGFELALVTRPADDDGVAAMPPQALQCKHGADHTSYPSDASVALDLEALSAAVGAGERPPLYRVPVIGPGEDGGHYDLLFDGCGEPIDDDLQDITYGPEPWLAHHPTTGTGWTVRCDGAVIDHIDGDAVVFGP